MADMMDTLKGLLGDNAGDKIKTALGALNAVSDSGSSKDDDSSGSSDNMPAPVRNQQINDDSLEYIMKIKNIADELSNPSDARSNLLMSLRPYMRSTRQKGIDNAVRILNLTKFSGLFR